MQVFLDVDDLEDLVFLERDIKATAVVLLFLTKSYFKSINCLREIRACEEDDKPLILVRETAPNKGGAPMERLLDECPEDLRKFVFSKGRLGRVIPFYRLERVWAMTLQQIATLAIGYSTHIITLKQWHSKRDNSHKSTTSSVIRNSAVLRRGSAVIHRGSDSVIRRGSVIHSACTAKGTALRRNSTAAPAAAAEAAEEAEAEAEAAAAAAAAPAPTSAADPAADPDPATSASAADAEPVSPATSFTRRAAASITAVARWKKAQAFVFQPSTSAELSWSGEETTSEGAPSAAAPGHSRNSSRDSSDMEHSVSAEHPVRGHLFHPKRRSLHRVSLAAKHERPAEDPPPPVVFPELYYPEAPGCCRASRRGDDGEELESNAVLFVSEDNPGAADLARELQQAAPTKLRLVYSSDELKPGYAEQLQECTHFLVLLNRQTFVKDTDPDRPGERLAKQLREAFRIKNHLNPANYRFKVSSK